MDIVDIFSVGCCVVVFVSFCCDVVVSIVEEVCTGDVD